MSTIFTSTHNEQSSVIYHSSFEETIALNSASAGAGNVAYRLLLQADDWPTLDDGKALTARETLLVASLSELAQQNPDHRLLAAFMIHMGLLACSSLAQRACQSTSRLDPKASAFLAKVTQIAYNIIEKSATSHGAALLPGRHWDAFDLIDGTLFFSVLHGPIEVSLKSSAGDRAAQYSQSLKNTSRVDCLPALKDLLDRIPDEVSSQKAVSSIDSAKPVLRFTHPAFDPYFEDVKITASSTLEPPNASKIFREATHWHNSKTLSKQKHKPLDKWALKRHQRFMASTKRYADSLSTTGPETVVLSRNGTLMAIPAWKQQLRQLSSAKNKQGRGKDLRAVPALAPRSTELAAAEQGWAIEKQDLEKGPNLHRRLEAAKLYESNFDYNKDLIGDEVSLYICSLLLAIFEKNVKLGQNSKLADIIAKIWSRLVVLKSKGLPHKLSLELSKLADGIQASTEKARVQGLYQGPTSIEHQLEHYGPQMERGFDSAPDSRVAFKPDAWQRKVLDAIDADKSICVISSRRPLPARRSSHSTP